MKISITKLIWLLAITSMFGCAASSDPIELSQNGPTMKEIYKSHMAGDKEVLNLSSGVQAEYKVQSDLQVVKDNGNAGARLPNPDLKMFMYPHRNEIDGVIIPGYSIALPMYDRVHYKILGQ